MNTQISTQSNLNIVGNKKSKIKLFLKQLDIQSMVWPGIIYLIIFSYIPMYGLIIAFKNYSIYSPGIQGFFTAPDVGFKYFEQFLTDPKFYEVLVNTLGINILGLVIGFPIPIIFALLLNELNNEKFKRFVQTVSYLPHFISWIIFGGLMMAILSTDSGIINNILVRQLGILKEPIFFMGEPNYFWLLIVILGLLKEMGWSAIMYLAAIAGVSNEMYEAAVIDGAGRFKRMWYITLPSITGVIVILLIFRISGMLNSGFDSVYVLQNPLNIPRSEVLDTYIYKLGIQSSRFSYSTAVGLAKSIVALILLALANITSKKVTGHGLY